MRKLKIEFSYEEMIVEEVIIDEWLMDHKNRISEKEIYL